MARSSRRSQTLTALVIFALLTGPAFGDVTLTPTPYKNLSQARGLLDIVDAQVLLPLDYHLEQQPGAESVLSQRASIQSARVYAHSSGAAIEIGLTRSARGTYDLVLLGDATRLRMIEPSLRRLTSEVSRAASSSASTPSLGYEMLRLGHIEADRAVALLKALGYYTIEFDPKGDGGDQIFNVVRGTTAKLPWVIKVANSSKTSLLQTEAGSRASSSRTTSSASKGGIQGAPQLGGSHLHSATAGSPEERLLLVYDRNDPEALEMLVNLLQTHVDVAAQQIVIEALVIEVNSSSLDDLGFEWRTNSRSASASFEQSEGSSSRTSSLLFSPDAFTDFNAFRVSLEALEESGDAEILSSPSVLVLNDRQARIQVGRQIPVARTTATTSAVTKGVEYFPIGIVLNLRPRIDRESAEVTMQIETIISSISPESAARLEAGAGDIEFSPIVDNRLVETFVRVADGTPFIIGGLLSTDVQENRVGVPGLASLPYIGRLFSRERIERERREVIVVLTPHIVPEDARQFSYLIPKDSDIFDRFDYTLFRNAYRVRDAEVWDLKFIQQSQVLLDIVARIDRHAEDDVMTRRTEPFASFLAGRIPGEEVLVRTMLKDIVRDLDYGADIDLEKVFFFEAGDDDNLLDRILDEALGNTLSDPSRGVLLSYDATSEPSAGSYFTYPFATLEEVEVPEGEVDRVLQLRTVNTTYEEGQPLRWAILLADENDVTHLRNVLILKRLLALNNKLPLTLQAFQPGLQVLFPSREDMSSRYHLIDADVAQLFYETSSSQYYPAFERVFNRKVREVESLIGRGGR